MQSETSLTGAVIAGRYQPSKRIGEGRTGQVFRARDAKTGERVAVKLLHKPLCVVPEPVRRFAREFEATSRIDHPNVVRSIAFGQETDGALAGTHYLVMELLDGRKLDEVMKAGRLDADRAVRIALDVAKALEAAHELGIVHRDVEPSNVVLSRCKGKEVAKVLDFGLARLGSSNEEALTDVGVRLGTPEYMSPEYVESGDASTAIHRLEIPEHSPAVGRRIVDLRLPQGALVVLVSRGEDFVVPQGSTLLQAGDTILVLADQASLPAIEAKLVGDR